MATVSRNSRSLEPKCRMTSAGSAPASAAIARTDVAAYPCRAKSRRAAVPIASFVSAPDPLRELAAASVTRPTLCGRPCER